MTRAQKLIHSFLGGYLLTYTTLASAENFDPSNLSIEQLMESQVSTVTKTEQKFSDTAAAVYVISQEDIQRSGVTNIPDVLRMAPGVQVARISAGKWAITARGFNGRYANKLLVLLDGRTVYSPTFAGVRWENLDLVLHDIERIEVIRGPGASVWGHNAVNGVINIITKHTEDTQQGLVSVVAGNEELPIVELRYGDQLGEHSHYRVYGKFTHRDGLLDLQGNDAQDKSTQGRGGFRADWNSNHGDRLMLEGDGYAGQINESFLLPTDKTSNTATHYSQDTSGANILGRWEHDFSVASTMHSQFFYEYSNIESTGFDNKSHTFDLDFQHDIAISKDNYFNWGLGYRFVADAYFEGDTYTVNPMQQNLHLVSAFLQDKALFFDGALQLTVGTKVQYYTLSGVDFQPSVRVLWKLHPEHRIWAAFSRATRSPSRVETAFDFVPLALPTPVPVSFVLQANPNLDREVVYSYELGYRGWLSNRLSWDMAFFYNDYQDLVSLSAGTFDIASRQVQVSPDNNTSATTWGIEMAAEWRPIDSLRLQLSYSLLQIDSTQVNQSRTAPENQLSLRGSYDINSTLLLDVWVRYVDSLSAQSLVAGIDNSVASYVGFDLRLAWKPIPQLELAIVGQNLNNAAHLEYIETALAYPKQLERSFYGQVQWYF
ncbi:MAG: iron complex outermembrane recepter protein [Methyloprofundus sp.]|nr:MAG: iron complex outermembrane recepter protein [Methyloprofundus sp.]